MSRNRRGNRPASMKARLAIATAVLVGGGAIGAVAVATSHNSTSATADSAGYSSNWGFQRTLSYGQALSTALADWGQTRSNQASLTALARMAPMRTVATQQRGRTTFATQRGVVLLVTKHWFLARSANGRLELWFFSGHTQFANVSNSAVGMSALTGSTAATTAAMAANNMVPATQVMTGTSTLATVTTPTARPVTVTATVNGIPGVTVTITVTETTATIAPSTTTAAQMTQTSMARPTTTRVFATMNHLRRGDMVLVAGVKSHNQLFAHLVLFTPPATTVTPTPSATATMPTARPTGTTTAIPTPSPTGTISGTHS